MELSVFQQIFEQLHKATKILIALPAALTADNVSSGLALALFLKKLNKEVEVVSAGEVPAQLAFLPGVEIVKNNLAVGNNFVIRVNTQTIPLDELSYETEADRLNIFLKPKSGRYSPEDVTFGSDESSYQAIVLLDCASLENVGALFDRHAEVFLGTPKINIDNKPSNEYFGAINFVDINASSIAEMLADLFSTYEQQLVDEDIATCLLAGIITKTNSFQHVQTTPKAFLKASELVGLGGRQQEIVKHFYKTKPLPLLRLWGRALARLKMTDQALYSLLSKSDFEKSEAAEADAVLVLKEMADNTSQYRLLALICEQGRGARLLLAAHPNIAMDKLSESFGGKLERLNVSLGNFQVFQIVVDSMQMMQAEQKLLGAIELL